MFSEKPLSSIVSTVPPELFVPISPISSASASPLSSAAHSRTSTITSNSFARCGLSASHQPNRQMKIGKYFLERTIGKGSFAVVKLATHCDTQQKVAIKIIDKSRLNPIDHKKLEREISVMKSLIHPYIIRLYEVMESKNLIYLVTEYAANGELLDLLIRSKRLSEIKAKEKFRQLVLAVEYIHSKNIVHRDLKTENLLLDDCGNIKVADFGFANTFTPNSKLQTCCGSPPYAAPELFQCIPYLPEKVDVWSLGVLLYVFVCGHLPFDSNNLTELRKRVLAGQFRLPFYISADCSSLISHMLTVNPEKRYTINDIKNHPWLMLNNTNLSYITSQTQSIPNSQLTNAILEHAESLGYNRTQILKSVNGNSYDSDAAIWHLLLEKFQQKCQINNRHTPNGETNPSEINDLTYCNSNNNKSLYTCDPDHCHTYLHHYTDDGRDQNNNNNNNNNGYNNDDEDNDDDDDVTKQLREQYAQTHGLRRHTLVQQECFVNNEINPTITSDGPYAYQSKMIEPSLLTNRLHRLQQQQQQQQQQQEQQRCDALIPNHDQCYLVSNSLMHHQRNPHSTSYNGLFLHSNVKTISDHHYEPQKNTNWLSPPSPDNFYLHRRASDSVAHLLLFQQQDSDINLNTVHPALLNNIKSPVSNRSSRGSITRGSPITPPAYTLPSRELNEKDDEDIESLNRYLNRGKRHTVCEQGLLLGIKARRGTRETAKDRGSLSRRASDTTTNCINSSAKAHLEGLYHNAVDSKLGDDDVTASSLQELHQLQKQIQKYSINNSTDSTNMRRGSTVPSPTNSTGLHIIREEHQQNSCLLKNLGGKSSSSSSEGEEEEGLYNIHKDDYEMDYDIPNQDFRQQQELRKQQYFVSSAYPVYRTTCNSRIPAPYSCNTSPLLTQHLTMSTMSSYMP